VISNLGITFAKAELRRVAQTLRLAGAFESPPEARRQYRSPVSGRVELLIGQYARVEAAQEIARVHSPQWRGMQVELDTLQADTAAARAELAHASAQRQAVEDAVARFPRRAEAYGPQMAALEEHRKSLLDARDQWKARVAELQDLAERVGGGASELAGARASLASAETALREEAEKRTGLERERAALALDQEAAQSELAVLQAAENTARARAKALEHSFTLRLGAAASMLGLPADELKDDAWRKLDAVPVRAASPGVVLSLHASEDELVEESAEICTVLDDSNVRFRARGLQADLGRLRDGLKARIVSPDGNGAAGDGEIRIAPTADADSRLLDVLMKPTDKPEWARPGVSAELEVTWSESSEPELAVPTRAIIRDGLEQVMFVRDSDDPNKVIRQAVTIGATDGRWTVVDYGVMEGSEVVLDGVYELKLTGAGKATAGGHFHADGTFHAGPD
jgi:multidrug resistance efflux pump